MLFDLEGIHSLPVRKILRLTHSFVAHARRSPFLGFDRSMHICLGRARNMTLFGAPEFIDRTEYRLVACAWNPVQSYATDFAPETSEWWPSGELRRARFCRRSAFRHGNLPSRTAAGGVPLDAENIRMFATSPDHRTACMAFAPKEKQHIDAWKNRLTEPGLPAGPWLTGLEAAVRRGYPDDKEVTI
ncbi:MAG: MBL fold metallo-hydrolase [Acidiferrobacterales bacterium]